MFQFSQFHDVFTCEVVDFYCLIFQQENFTSDLKSSEVELWNILSFNKEKGDQKVLIFGSYYSELGAHGRDNRHKKVKSIVIIYVCNDFDIKFWCF